jgi:hypothetical protein
MSTAEARRGEDDERKKKLRLALSFASSRTLAKLKLLGALRGAPSRLAEDSEGSEKVMVMASGALLAVKWEEPTATERIVGFAREP